MPCIDLDTFAFSKGLNYNQVQVICMIFSQRKPLLILVTLLVLPAWVGSALGQANRTRQTSVISAAAAADTELARVRADVLRKMRDSRAGTEKLIALREEEVRKLTEEYGKRRQFYDQGLISKKELNQSEHSLGEAIARLQDDKRWLSDQDIAITEASMREELLHSPSLGAGGDSETGSLIRFNGNRVWSIADAPRIQNFFFQTFGRGLPVSAHGQTGIHDRLQLDHRNALDVALHPDSQEGQSLMSHLRQSRIPFIAFRNAVPGSSTGAHIHIGRPSPSLRTAMRR
jgi:hypothetical protein